MPALVIFGSFALIKFAQADVAFPEFNDDTDIGGFIEKIYIFSISIVGLLIFIRILQAGVYYFGSSVGATENKGTEMVKDALIGALILLSAYFILNIINPDLTKTNIFDLNKYKGDMQQYKESSSDKAGLPPGRQPPPN